MKQLKIAEQASNYSTESTKIGCVLFNSRTDDEILAVAFNHRYSDILVHAEKSLILSCAKHGIPTQGKTLVLNYYPPCLDCAELILLSGIQTVVYNCPKIPERWVEKCEKGIILLQRHIEIINYKE